MPCLEIVMPKQDVETKNRLAADLTSAGVLFRPDKTSRGRRFDKWSKISKVQNRPFTDDNDNDDLR